jgi:hypothetical protein
MSNKFRSVEHQAIAIMTETSGKFVGNRGSSFRTSSTSNPDDWHDKSGLDVGAARNTAHQDAARKADAESERAKEKQIKDRTEKAEQRKKETMNMAKEEVMAEGKTFVYDKPNPSTVKAYTGRDTGELKDMHARWSKDHANPKSDPITSEKLLAVHHVLKTRGESMGDLPKHKNLGMSKMSEETNTEKRMSIRNVARPDDADPMSEKSKLTKQAEIKNKVVESAPKIDFGLPKSLIDATRSILEKNTKVELNPETNDRDMNDDENEKVKESKHTTPKTEKEKKLAALAKPKDKITHKDVLVGRGVLAKEEVEQVDEVHGAFTGAPTTRQVDVRNFGYDRQKAGDHPQNKKAVQSARNALGSRKGNVIGIPDDHAQFHKEEVGLDEISKSTLGSYVKKSGAERGHLGMDAVAFTDKKNKKETLRKMKNRLTGINRAVDRLTKEEVDFTTDELEHLESIMSSFTDENAVNEAKDEREYGYEGEMVSSQLRSIIQNAEALLGMIQPDTDFPEWVQSKITLAQDYMLSAKDYMSTEMSEETKLDEARGRPKKTGEAPEGDDTHKHPIQQLSKIGYAIQGSEPAFEHKDGSKTKITKQLARHITTAYNAMRTSQEKDDFATKLHANRDSMMAAVKKHV